MLTKITKQRGTFIFLVVAQRLLSARTANVSLLRYLSSTRGRPDCMIRSFPAVNLCSIDIIVGGRRAKISRRQRGRQMDKRGVEDEEIKQRRGGEGEYTAGARHCCCGATHTRQAPDRRNLHLGMYGMKRNTPLVTTQVAAAQSRRVVTFKRTQMLTIVSPSSPLAPPERYRAPLPPTSAPAASLGSRLVKGWIPSSEVGFPEIEGAT